NCLLHFPFHLDLLESAKFSNSVVNVRNVIAHFQVGKFLKRDGLLLGITIFQLKFMIAFKDLMICITRHSGCFVDKSLEHGKNRSMVLNLALLIVKNVVKPFCLLLAYAKNIIGVP